jgi:hypothetical protein
MIKTSIQIRAAFLILVFSLNTLIGFACAIGIDMGFNSSHHHDEEASEAEVHIHKDGKKHVHHEEAKHHHEKDGKDNCCNDKVIKFNEVDKSASHSLNASINPVFLTIFPYSFYSAHVLYTSYIKTDSKYFVRSHHPPIPDIRIAIRSFQI